MKLRKTLRIIGPQLLRPSSEISYSDLTFRHENMNPLVAEIYRAAYRATNRLEVQASFPWAEPEKSPREQWLDAVSSLTTADAALAVFAGRKKRAIPVEADLARLMNLPLLVAAIDPHFIRPFEEEGVTVISADPAGVEWAIEELFDERGGNRGAPWGGGLSPDPEVLYPYLPPEPEGLYPYRPPDPPSPQLYQ